MTIEVGQSSTLVRVVGADDTAIALGSGDLAVLATPRAIAWCESATLEAVSGSIPEHQTTVGARVEFDHLAPSVIGAEVVVTARVTAVTGRRVVFEVDAVEAGRMIGRGIVRRVVVDRRGFGV